MDEINPKRMKKYFDEGSQMNLSYRTESELDLISERGSLKLSDLLSRGLPAADVLEVHRIKQSFDGEVVPSVEVTRFKPV